MIILNDGTDSYMYSFADTVTANTTIDANELTLVGTISGQVVLSADVSQTV